MALIKCSECGRMVSDKANVCPQCGNPISASAQATPNSSPTKKSNKKLYLFLFVAAALALVGFGVNFFLNMEEDDTDKKVELSEEFIQRIKSYDELSMFSQGRAAVCKNGKWGFMNTVGEEVIPCEYEEACGFSEGLAVVKKDGKFGYIDRKGKIVVPFEYDFAVSMKDSIAIVVKTATDNNGIFLAYPKLTFLDHKGKEYAELNKLNLRSFMMDYGETGERELGVYVRNKIICSVYKSNAQGDYADESDVFCFNIQGKEVECPEEDEDVSSGYLVDYAEKMGVLDHQGKRIIESKFQEIYAFLNNGVFYAVLGDYFENEKYHKIDGYVDLDGNETFTAEDYKKIADYEKRLEEERLRQEEEEARLEAERQRKAAMEWIKGTWEYRAYGSVLRIVIDESYLKQYIDNDLSYNGQYEIEDGNIKFNKGNGGCDYIPIDYDNRRLMADANTPMVKVNVSSRSEATPNNSKTEVVSFRTHADVMSYLSWNSFTNGSEVIEIREYALLLNGQPFTGAPIVKRFTQDRAFIEVSPLTGGKLYLTVYPQQGKIVDGSGDVYTIRRRR